MIPFNERPEVKTFRFPVLPTCPLPSNPSITFSISLFQSRGCRYYFLPRDPEKRATFFIPLVSPPLSLLSFHSTPTSRIPFFEKERSDNNGGRRLSLRHYSRRASKDNRLDSQSLLKLSRIRNRGNSFFVENNTNCCCHLEALNLVNVIKRRKRHSLLLSSVVPILLKIGLLGSDARRAIRSFEEPSQCAVLERRP